jgi:hypothetical protein
MIRAYWDESGSTKDLNCPYLGMGGFIAPAGVWDRFEKSWKGALDEFGVPYFHAKEVEHNDKKGPFRDKAVWTPQHKLAFRMRLVSCIADTQPAIVGAVLDLPAWRSLSSDEQDAFIDPWLCCLQECVRLSVGTALFDPDTGESIATVFSQQEEFRERGLALWNGVRKRTDDGFDRLGAFVMEDMRKLVALQAADLIVYEVVKNTPRFATGGAIRPAMSMLIAADPNMFVARIDAGYLAWQLEDVSRDESSNSNRTSGERRISR